METKYDYYGTMFQDIENYIAENEIKVTGPNSVDFDQLYDELFCCDYVTGNASGSYTFNAWTAAECVCHNEDLLDSALHEMYGAKVPVNCVTSPEWCDVIIRCYLLADVLNSVLGSIAEDVEDYYIAHNMEE